VVVKGLTFQYKSPYHDPVNALNDCNFVLPKGARCLLLGCNGAGKSSLLKVLAGKHLLEDEEMCVVLGKCSFYQTLGLSGVSFLGGGWTRNVAFAGNNVAYQADIAVSEMMPELQAEYPERRDKLIEILEIDKNWSMHRVSDGQRRRVQIMLGLLRPFKLLLLDEMTVDLDILARRAFLKFLDEECQERNATVVYATHIFDGLGDWPSHLLFLEGGEVSQFGEYDKDFRSKPSFKSLYDLVADFLQEQHDKRKQKALLDAKKTKAPVVKKPVEAFATPPNCGYTPGRMAAYFAAGGK